MSEAVKCDKCHEYPKDLKQAVTQAQFIRAAEIAMEAAVHAEEQMRDGGNFTLYGLFMGIATSIMAVAGFVLVFGWLVVMLGGVK